jgi:hypothetical protein
MNMFASLKAKTFDTVTHVMGYTARWTGSEAGILQTARVGFKDPSEKMELSGIDSWNPDEPFMEYRAGFFPGLKEAVDAALPEFVYIYESLTPTEVLKGYFAVKEVKTKFDGDTFVARLIKTNPPT